MRRKLHVYMKRIAVLLVLFLSLIYMACNAEESIDPAKIAVGDTVTFGSYEQDNHLDNGPEPIEWIVLDVKNNRALLISKYILDTQPYNSEYHDIAWEDCSLRSWLNHDFFNTAFSEREQESILITDIDNSAAQSSISWESIPGNDTQDRVFLLSYREAEELLSAEMNRCAPTDYAIGNGAWSNSAVKTNGRAAGVWWLRSRSSGAGYITGIFAGTVDCLGKPDYGHVNIHDAGVRPALWIDLNTEP